MKAIDRARGPADRLQRRRPVLGLPVAVLLKFTDDQAGNLAALIAYYGFVSLFPLLLLLSAVLNVLLKNDPHLRASLINSALAQYPVIGPYIQRETTGTVPGSGLAFVFSALFLLFGARGIARAMQNAICSVWGIPRDRRPKFPRSLLWGLALILAVGVGFIVTTFLSGLAGGVGHGAFIGAGAHVAAVAIAVVLNVGMFWLSFWLAAMRRVHWRDLRIGATIAGAVWTVLQLAGGYVVAHQLHRANELYGSFGLVLGLIFWLFVQAEVTVLAAEVDVVLAKRLWPRSLPGTGEPAAAGRPDAKVAAAPAAASEAPATPASTTAASAADPAASAADPAVPAPRPTGEDRTGATPHGDAKGGKVS